MKIKRIHDNQGKTFDRYTVVFQDGSGLALSHNPDSPDGFSQWCCCVVQGADLGKQIRFRDLPQRIQQHIRQRIKGALK